MVHVVYVRCLVALLLVVSLSQATPSRAWADGGASTRNIIFGGAAAAGTLLILNHNKQVHERYAEDAQRQAALAGERNDAQAAYAAERSAYLQQLSVTKDLQKEVAFQHEVVVRLEREVAQANKHAAALAQARSAVPVVSYGWGRL